MREPLLHQEAALAYTLPRDRAAIYMEMRLGKSLVASRWIAAGEGPALIVSPLTTLLAWTRELELEGVASVILRGPSKQKLRSLDASPVDAVVLVNPEGVRACPEILRARPFTSIVVDESTLLRNPRAKITRTLRGSADVFPRRAILSGMPAPEGPEDYVEQMLFVFDEFMGHKSFWAWRMEYMRPGAFGWEPRPSTASAVKRAVRELAFTMTTGQAGLGRTWIRERRCVEPSTIVRAAIREARREWAIGDVETKWAIVVASWLSQLAAGIVPGSDVFSPEKTREVVALATGELRGKQMAVFCRYTREIVETIKLLRRAGIAAARLDGSTPLERRGLVLDAFRGGDVRVVVVQQRCGRFALDLSAADVAVFTSNEWSWETRAQCERRIEHPTKDRPLLVVDVVTRGTVDEAVLDVLSEKGRSARYFMQRVLARVRERES